MPVKRRNPKIRRSDYPTWQFDILKFGVVTPAHAEQANQLEMASWLYPDRKTKREIRRLWEFYGEHILHAWIGERPGSRPFAWWLFDEPRRERMRLSGTGSPMHSCLNVRPTFQWGIPNLWITPFLADYYRGKARDVHGELIVCSVANPRFGGIAVDPDHLPTYESQAAYLERNSLMTIDERRRVKPSAFDPEQIPKPIERQNENGK